MCWNCVTEYAADAHTPAGAAAALAAARGDVRVVAAAQVCRDFYELPGCSMGGPLHVVIDDTNVEDAFLDVANGFDEWVQSLQNGRDNLDEPAVALVREQADAVAAALLPLTLVERATATVLSHDLEASA